METQEKNSFMDKIIGRSLNYSKRLIELEEIEIDNFLRNRRKLKYNFFLFFRFVLFLAIFVFAIIDFNNPIVDIIVPMAIIVIIVVLNSYIRDILEGFNYVKFKRKIKRVNQYINSFKLCFDNDFFMQYFKLENKYKNQLKTLQDDMKGLNELLKPKLDYWRISEFIGIVIATVSFFILPPNWVITSETLGDFLLIAFLLINFFYLENYFTSFQYFGAREELLTQMFLEEKILNRIQRYDNFFKEIIDALFSLTDIKGERVEEITKSLKDFEEKSQKNDEYIFKRFNIT